MHRTFRAIIVILASVAAAFLAIRAFPANRDALRQIVQEQCMVHWASAEHSAAPCERIVVPAGNGAGGYAVLADRKGGAHFLLIPTKTIVGVESPDVLAAGAPNYFAAAWEARDRVAAAAGRDVRRAAVGLALNPKRSRSQDQLHIHIECLRPQVVQSLGAEAGRMRGTWTPVSVAGFKFYALRVMSEDLVAANPFRLLAARSLRGRSQLIS